MSIHNITEYKKSMLMVKELEKILKIVNATQSSLANYRRYLPVQHILTTISEFKPFLEIALEQRKIMVETKGRTK
jgi:hypothetical protein